MLSRIIEYLGELFFPSDEEIDELIEIIDEEEEEMVRLIQDQEFVDISIFENEDFIRELQAEFRPPENAVFPEVHIATGFYSSRDNQAFDAMNPDFRAEIVVGEVFSLWEDEDNHWKHPDRLRYDPREGF